MGRRLQTIYEVLNGYSKDAIDRAIINLSEEHKSVIFLRYGVDLENPVTSKLFDNKAKYTFYGYIMPKLKKELRKQNFVSITNDKVSTVVEETIDKKEEILVTPKEEDVVTKQSIASKNEEVIVEDKLQLEETKDMVLSKNDYFKALSLLQTPNFSKILSDFTIEEAIIVCLKLGYIDGKHFETKAIAEFLGMDEKRIYEVVHKFLAIYKENVLEFIDKIIEGANKENFSLTKKLDN